MSLLHLFKKIGFRVQLSSCEYPLIVCCFDFSSVFTFTTIISCLHLYLYAFHCLRHLVASSFLCLLEKVTLLQLCISKQTVCRTTTVNIMDLPAVVVVEPPVDVVVVVVVAVALAIVGIVKYSGVVTWWPYGRVPPGYNKTSMY